MLLLGRSVCSAQYRVVQLNFKPDIEIFNMLFVRCHSNKMVNPYNGPVTKLSTPPTLTLVKMTITGHHMVIQTTLPKIAQALMLTPAQVAKVT